MSGLCAKVAIASITLVAAVSAHGWVVSPISKNEMAYHHYQWQPPMPIDFQYEPQTSNRGNGIGDKEVGKGFSCGALDGNNTIGLSVWQQWYDKAGVDVPRFTPGQDLPMKMKLTIDHGGQSWMQIACGDHIAETTNWTTLERSQSDRDAHFMPSAPGAFGWAPLEFIKQGGDMSTVYTIPEDFSCPSGQGVGRWIWKTGNSCNDVKNIGRSTEKFNLTDFAAIVKKQTGSSWVNQPCGTPPESFISCFDFVTGVTPGPPTPPTPPAPPTPCADPQKVFKQCGGRTWKGSTCCDPGCTCEGGDWFKQCTAPKGKRVCTP